MWRKLVEYSEFDQIKSSVLCTVSHGHGHSHDVCDVCAVCLSVSQSVNQSVSLSRYLFRTEHILVLARRRTRSKTRVWFQLKYSKTSLVFDSSDFDFLCPYNTGSESVHIKILLHLLIQTLVHSLTPKLALLLSRTLLLCSRPAQRADVKNDAGCRLKTETWAKRLLYSFILESWNWTMALFDFKCTIPIGQ